MRQLDFYWARGRALSPGPSPNSLGEGRRQTPSPRVGGGLGWGLSAVALSPGPSPNSLGEGRRHAPSPRVGGGLGWGLSLG